MPARQHTGRLHHVVVDLKGGAHRMRSHQASSYRRANSAFPPIASAALTNDSSALMSVSLRGVRQRPMQGLGSPQTQAGIALQPAAGQEKVVATRFQHAEPFPAEQFQGRPNRFHPSRQEFAAAASHGRGEGEFQQNQVADPELAFIHGREPGRRRRIASVVVEQRHQQTGIEIEAAGAWIQGS